MSKLSNICSALVVGTLMTVPVVGLSTQGLANNNNYKRACLRNFTGTYLTKIEDANGQTTSRSLITLNIDGNFTVADSGQGGSPGVFNPFSETHGTWKCTGRRSIKATGLNFSFGSDSESSSIGRTDYEVKFNKTNKTISGTIDLSFFKLDEDPLKSPGKDPIPFTFKGEPVTAY